MNFTRSQGHSPAVRHSTTERSELEHLFDFELQATPGRQPYISTEGREGSFITNSIGTLTGKVRGKIRMSFFAIDCAYLLGQALRVAQHSIRSLGRAVRRRERLGKLQRLHTPVRLGRRIPHRNAQPSLRLWRALPLVLGRLNVYSEYPRE
jgi:hypothetical protein